MARYIDAEDFEKRMEGMVEEYMWDVLEETPTADVVEVVRCKDCKHRDQYECNHIMLGGTKCGVIDNWFCADGERKETEDAKIC